MIIAIHTQYCENYGTPEVPYWKFKGGDTYIVEGFRLPLDSNIGTKAQAIVDMVRPTIEYRNDMSEVFMLDWEISLDDNYMSQDAKNQLEFDGRIDYPDPRINYMTLLSEAA